LHRVVTGRHNERVLAFSAPLPRLVRWGIGILLVGLGVDLAVHLLDRAAGLVAAIGHLVTLAGMLIAVIGTVVLALSSGRRREGEGRAGSDLAVG
jgi:hypothetical protein